jgi:hypothetical protein
VDPGSASSGALKITFEPESTFGVLVTDSQRISSSLKNQ